MKRETAKIKIISNSAEQTFEIARHIGEKAKDGDLFALSGELGSGKTCFTKGLALGLGVSAEYQITSPTFTLINEYPARCKLYHFDVYRLNGYSEFEDLGYEEYFAGDGVVVIEWAEKIAKLIPRDSIFINFEYVDENSRKMIIRGLKSRLNELAIDKKMEVG
jgi:tRNA threonylcarbamoyladenosine biosynthesis protein TsaE